MKAVLVLFAVLCSFMPLHAQTPEWIWFRKSDDAETRYFRKSFMLDGPVSSAELMTTADDGFEVFLNGRRVLAGRRWQTPYKADVKDRLRTGRNVLAIRAYNGDSSAAALLVQLTLTTPAGKQVFISDNSWKAEDRELPNWNQIAIDDAAWPTAESLGRLGMQPWGNILAAPAPERERPRTVRQATPAEAIYVLKDFKVELLLSGGPDDGSWVNLCKDHKGRLIISPQYRGNNPDAGLIRITLGSDGQVAKRDLIAKSLYDAQGMTFANGALWVVINKYSTKFESGLYRITDDGTDTWNQIELIKRLPGGGEHGPHAVELGPDGNLWVMAGNHTKPPEGLSPDSPHKNYAEDHVLPRQPDGNGHATGVMAPGGYICRVSPDGKKWDFFCAGFRNQFDFAFNVDDEIFAWDADMEYDWGMPWYRPTRLNHAVSGAEFGWRYGTGKWPDYYPDSLGAVVNIGLGSPTGVASGKGAKFPAKYQQAIYVMDWTYGRLIAVHLKPDGASYTGSYENFVAPAGLIDASKDKATLNLTDLIIGNDGAMYFTIGGRNTAAGLYRVTYTGSQSTAPAWTPNRAGAEARAIRRKLETLHGQANPEALDFLWPHLGSPDRAIRYAARIALEAHPVEQWRDRALEESSPDAGLNALLALARVGGKSAQPDCWRGVGKWPMRGLSERQQVDKLRILQVSIARHGLPPSGLAETAISKLSASYPNKSPLVNRELSQVLIALGAPEVVSKTLPLMAAAETQEELMHYLFHLRNAKHWNAGQRREYFSYWTDARKRYPHDPQLLQWFKEAGRPYTDGASFNKFLANFLKDAAATLTESERAEFEPLLASIASPAPVRKPKSEFPAPRERTYVNSWTMADFATDLGKMSSRNFQRGRQAFVDSQCLACHRMGDEGGGVGPDLTAISSRFNRIDILESILEPDKVLSEQFQNTTVILKNEEDYTGRLVDETPDQIVLVPNQLEPDKTVTVKKSDIVQRKASTVSPMPTGLANVLTREELLDLLAFLEAGGTPNHAAFKQ